MTDETVADVLCSDVDNCRRLREALRGPGPVVWEQLDYEDLFYPLRHHSGGGLVLRIDHGDGEFYVEWGSGDLIYDLRDSVRSVRTAVDPFPLWNKIQAGVVEAEPVLRADTPFAED